MRPSHLGRGYFAGLSCLVLALPALATAQDMTQPARSQSVMVDFGVRGTSSDGDAARYERYRDLGNGLFLDALRWNSDRGGWLFRLSADHAGRKDQRFVGELVRPGRLKASGLWDQIPMLMSRTTRTLFTVQSPGVLTVDDAIQSQVQASATSLAALFSTSARTFDLKSRRHIAEGRVEYLITPELTVRSSVKRTGREGSIPFGGSFGHSSLVETPAPVNHSLVDVDAGAEFSRQRVLLRGGYTGSFFHNDTTSLTFDSPFRLTDSATAGARGALALAPSNSLVGVNGLASVSLPHRTRATASLSIGSMKNSADTTIMAHTVNSALAAIPLERSSVNGEARTLGTTLSLASRPSKMIDMSVRYRAYQYDNRTPEFTITQRVAYDNSVSALATPKETEPYGVTRHTLDADIRMMPGSGISAGLGYSRTKEDRTHRIFTSTADNVVRFTFDVPKSRWFTLRSKFEHSEKRGTGDAAEIADELAAVGEQPGMRHFDIASRNRNRLTVLGSVMPKEYLGLTFSLAGGKDDYFESLFGLRDNTHRVYSAGFDVVPAERNITFGGSYDYERYQALSRSRQANPGAQFLDPSRNWAADGTDRVHSLLLHAGVTKIADKVDVLVSYDYNRARALYAYITGPVTDRTLPEEVVVATTLPLPTQLPLVRSELQRGTVDVVYALSARLGLGLSYWHEDYKVADFTLDADANPDLARGQAILLGYLYRPYTARTVWGRLIYRW
jgi:MtrB/PioB family decaheme-associated outer membrane protein